MRRFLVTYTVDGHSIDIEAIQFSSGLIFMELYPGADFPLPRTVFTYSTMEEMRHEFGDAPVKWLDAEVKPC